jgi:L,D-peptidoglycan transpeptidase YkuD (ErfK/YbiS/YcfS/YnhG family)
MVAGRPPRPAANASARPPHRPRPGRLWRQDGLYDLVIEIDHNVRPRAARRGSAVFIHVARAGFAPTAGCIALRRQDLTLLLSRITTKTRIVIHR